MMTPLLEVRGLVVRAAGEAILQVEHLSIQDGEVLAVIGPNGAGKSTLVMVMSSLIQPDAGEVRYRGNLVEGRNALNYRRRTSLVLQAPLLQRTSVYNNVAAGLRFHGLPRGEVQRRVEAWLDQLNIAHLKGRSIAHLSGGEAQRVSLARALAIQPDLLYLDEPFSALDNPTRMQLLEELKNLVTRHSITTVFVTHNLDEALYLGDRVAVLMGGRLRQIGAPEEVFNKPADPQIAAFVGVETILSANVMRVDNGRLLLDSGGTHIEACGEGSPGSQVWLCLRPEDVHIGPAGEDPAVNEVNRLKGRLTALTPNGPLLRVVVDCGFPLVALLPRPSARELGLSIGQMVEANFKPAALHVIPKAENDPSR
jgi:ABC-type Fe3+/spermidine/putrescine transport system ATPase subunit